jgi:hypothetical protein
MAFQSASGHSNLPNGNFSPVIYSKKVQKTFRKKSVVEDITNNDYFGEISNHGDSVKIIKEPEITVASYARGQTLTSQDIQDDDFSLIIDQANAYQFQIDDIETAHSHVNFMDLATDRAAYSLKDKYDSEVLGYMSGFERNAADNAWIARSAANGTKADSAAGADELLAANKMNITTWGGSAVSGTTGAAVHALTSVPLATGGGSGAITSPLQLLNRINRQMDVSNVDSDNRWIVLDPIVIEMLMDEDSKLMNADWGGNGQLMSGSEPTQLRGFKVYKSNNLPYFGTGADTSASAGSRTNFGVIVAGHGSAVATAQTLAKTESFRAPDTFADRVRGMQLYGRKILRPNALFTAHYNVA